MRKGYLCIILHAHLPYVRHTEEKKYMEERWFFEAMTETYAPILSTLHKLHEDEVRVRLTVSLSPTLLSMMNDTLLQQRYKAHLGGLIELGEKEVSRTSQDGVMNYTARCYLRRFMAIHELIFGRYKGNIVRGYCELADAGLVELATSCATHGYLPLLSVVPSSVEAQVHVGIDTFRHITGREPAGLWLPECGYFRGLEDVLARNGIKYVVLETHGILDAEPSPSCGVFAPVECAGNVAAFGRDAESAKQVWSSQEGYPGDPDYREFYRDIGHELPLDYIGQYVHDDSVRVDTGFKYYRITGRTEHKQPYQPEWAREKAAIHAGNFVFNRQKQVEHCLSVMQHPPVVVAPYDAELIGHWWYEGPEWLDYLARKICFDQHTIEMITPLEYLSRFGTAQQVQPATSSWGYGGYHEVWLNGKNDWMLPYVHWAGKKMRRLAERHAGRGGAMEEALNQAARELLLLESSDWPFILNAGTAVQYATRRFEAHYNRFELLSSQIERGSPDTAQVRALFAQDNIFPEITSEVYAR